MWFVNNFKMEKKNVFDVNVFLLITNALACHLQCSAHVTCYLFYVP